VSFFSSAGRADLSEDWRSLQAALDAFGAAHTAAASGAVVAGACVTFSALSEQLDDELAP
jgi:heme oxygenase